MHINSEALQIRNVLPEMSGDGKVIGRMAKSRANLLRSLQRELVNIHPGGVIVEAIESRGLLLETSK